MTDDLIGRQQAIDALRDYLVGKRCPDDGTLTCRLIENEVINKLPSIQPERKTGRWIPVSERLPVPYEDVWCCSDIGQVVGYCDATGFWVGRGELELIVTAWMPLPEPYQEGGAE